jgi:WD40-like Beta Propeller Repeat
VFPERAELVVIPATGGIKRVVCELALTPNAWHPDEPENNGAAGPVWSPDGSSLFLAGSADKNMASRILRIDLEGKKQALTAPPIGTSDMGPEISPSGESIAFVRNWSSGAFDLYVMSSPGGTPVRLTSDSRDIRGRRGSTIATSYIARIARAIFICGRSPPRAVARNLFLPAVPNPSGRQFPTTAIGSRMSSR